MTTTALAPRAAPSLYQGIILALILCAFALQASFLVGLARGGVGAFGAAPAAAAVSGPASPRASAAPCQAP